MGAISNRSPSIIVTYIKGKGRAEKLFTDAYAARRFFVAKLAAGKEPQLRSLDDAK